MAKALVLLSGGQDSATCLAIAKSTYATVRAIAFDYNQRHRIELDQARYLAAYTQTPLQVVSVPVLQDAHSALTQHDQPITQGASGLPTTFVPGRNHIFLTLAASVAYDQDIAHIYTGVCEADYAGYPDCRAAFIAAAEQAIRLSLDREINIHAPLLYKTKAASIHQMQALGKLAWYAHTHTCYDGMRPACGQCPACILRLKGFQDAGIPDPLAYRTKTISSY